MTFWMKRVKYASKRRSLVFRLNAVAQKRLCLSSLLSKKNTEASLASLSYSSRAPTKWSAIFAFGVLFELCLNLQLFNCCVLVTTLVTCENKLHLHAFFSVPNRGCLKKTMEIYFTTYQQLDERF